MRVDEEISEQQLLLGSPLKSFALIAELDVPDLVLPDSIREVLKAWPYGSGPRRLPEGTQPLFRTHRGSDGTSSHLEQQSKVNRAASQSPTKSLTSRQTETMSGHWDGAPHLVPKWQEPEFLFKIPGMMKTAAPTLSSTGDNYNNWRYWVESLVEKLTKSMDFLIDHMDL